MDQPPPTAYPALYHCIISHPPRLVLPAATLINIRMTLWLLAKTVIQLAQLAGQHSPTAWLAQEHCISNKAHRNAFLLAISISTKMSLLISVRNVTRIAPHVLGLQRIAWAAAGCFTWIYWLLSALMSAQVIRSRILWITPVHLVIVPAALAQGLQMQIASLAQTLLTSYLNTDVCLRVQTGSQRMLQRLVILALILHL